MTTITKIAALLIAGAVIATAPAAHAQSRLPATVTTNTFTMGQLMGCLIRAEVYVEISSTRLASVNLATPPAYQNPSFIVGVDLAALRGDLEQAFTQLFGASYSHLEQEVLIAEIARTEYDSPLAGRPNYFESWVQMAACGYLYHVHDLYEAYPPK